MGTDPNNTRYVFNFQQGEDGWDDEMVTAMDRLDEDVVQVGKLSNRPAPDADQAPNFYYARDKDREYYNTGSSWRSRQIGAVASPGEVQSTIDSQASSGPGGYVRLKPGEQYDEGVEIHVKPEVTLDCRGAEIHISSDHNGLFVDDEAHVLGLRLRQKSSTFTSAGVVLDTTRSRGGSYNRTGNTYETVVTGAMVNDNDRSGTGLLLNASNGPISIPNYFRLSLYTFGIGIDGQVQDNSFINGVKFDQMVLHGNQTQVRHTQGADGTGGPFVGEIHGVSQNSQYVDHIVDNQTSKGSVTMVGDMWDTANMDTSAGASVATGTKVTFKTRDFMAREIANNSPDAGSGCAAYGWGNGRRVQAELGNGTTWEEILDAGERKINKDGTTVYRRTTSDDIATEIAGQGIVVRTPDGLSTYRIRVDNSGNVVTDQVT